MTSLHQRRLIKAHNHERDVWDEKQRLEQTRQQQHKSMSLLCWWSRDGARSHLIVSHASVHPCADLHPSGGKEDTNGNPAQKLGWMLRCFNIWWHLVTSELQILSSPYPLHHAVLGCFNPLPLLSSQIWLLMLWLWPRLNIVVQKDIWMYAALMEAILSLIINLS